MKYSDEDLEIFKDKILKNEVILVLTTTITICLFLKNIFY